MSTLGWWRALGAMLPEGRPLPERDWRARHRAILTVLALHVVGILLYALWLGYAPPHALLDTTPVAGLTALAATGRLSRRIRASMATLGAMTSSAILVHLSHGLIEMHFHFFVMLIVVTFYQEWLAFLVAAGFVLFEHAVVGVLAPHAIYNHEGAWANPVRWALIHALFISGAGVAAIINWRLTEKAQAAERASAERLAYEASHDPLTGALNRRELDRRFAALPAGGRHAVCFLDLDRFKIVNDSCGHAAGDVLLCQVTELVRGELGGHDELARVGGDEFVVLLRDCDLDRAAAVAERIRRLVAEHRFLHGGRIYSVGLSAGVVALDMTTVAGERPGRDALRAADAACYTAKHAGRNRVHVATLDDGVLSRQERQVRWAELLLHALDTDAFVLYYQPIAALTPTATEHYGELLLRLRGEDGELITPGAFLPAAERYNLVTALDRWVVGAAFAALAGRAAGHDELFSINLSGGSLGDESLLRFIRDQLAEHGIPPYTICFEVTETVAITDLAVAAAFITELRALGCRFALDDFGSGLSSFTYLKRLPVDFVKIDGSFVRGMTDDAVDRAMVESVNRISHEMGLRTVAEFVENDAIVAELRALGVDHAQGWAVGRPVPFGAWLTANPARRAVAHAIPH